jgi:N-acetylglucosamine kinase-like BadF-type ATPase
VVVIAGTGSVAYGENERGETAQTGGWGHLLGDEGSGYWLAMETIRRAIYAYESSEERRKPLANPLASIALKHFQTADLRSLALAIYGEKFSRDEIAAFARLVQESAVAGNSETQQIVRRGCEALFSLAATTARKLKLKRALLVCVGGVFRGAAARAEFAKLRARRWPEAELAQPRFDPAVGALLLAYQAAGRVIDEEVLTNLAKEKRSI